MTIKELKERLKGDKLRTINNDLSPVHADDTDLVEWYYLYDETRYYNVYSVMVKGTQL